jgi:hypothetical protein
MILFLSIKRPGKNKNKLLLKHHVPEAISFPGQFLGDGTLIFNGMSPISM